MNGRNPHLQMAIIILNIEANFTNLITLPPMKKIIKIVVVVVLLAFAGLVSYVKFMLPNVGEPEDIKIEITDARIERGRYLANSVSVCMDCHSTRDWTKFSGPLTEGTLGIGGEEFSQKFRISRGFLFEKYHTLCAC